MTPTDLKKLLDDPAVPALEIQSRLATLAEHERAQLVALSSERGGLDDAARMRLDSALRSLQATRVRRTEEPVPGPHSAPTQLRELARTQGQPLATPSAATQLRSPEPPRQSDPTRPQPERNSASAQRAPATGRSEQASASTQLRSPNAGQAGAAATPAAQAGTDPHAGLVLKGRYRLESQVGQGAMGQVWRARDLLSEEAGAAQSWLAIKLFVADFATAPDALAIMQREASRAEGLAHPNIVTVRFFDRDESSGLLYMGMDLIEGESLEDTLRKTAPDGLGRKQGGALIRGIAEGLAHAHAKGIIHCDLKPGNILVTRDGVPKILDFGIAQAVTKGEGYASAAAETPLLSGYTEIYASPEVLGDDSPGAGESDDVYALGVVAYELLCGRRPYGEVSALQARRKGLKPARIPGLRRHEWRALVKALALERSARWPSVAAFRKAYVGRSAVQQVLVGAVVAAVLAAGFFGYRSYVASGPDVPLSALPAGVRSQVEQSIAKGREALDYVLRTKDYNVLDDAVDAFDQAYALHPRDRDAVAGLKKAADLIMGWAATRTDRSEAVHQLQTFSQHTPQSGFYRDYPPLNHMIERLEQR